MFDYKGRHMNSQPPDGWNNPGTFQQPGSTYPGGYPPSQPPYGPGPQYQPTNPGGYLPAPTGNYPQYGLMVRGPRRPQGSAVAVEAILALFGIYGVGWLMSGLTTAGAVIMSLGFVWDVAIVIVAIATLGIGALCLVPMHFLFVTLTTVMLSNQIITD